MRILLVGTEKGGATKTSLAFNLACCRARAGYQVLLVDADKQASSSMWASLRAEEGIEPRLICVQKLGKIGLDLVQLAQNYEVVIDAGGADSVELRQGIAVATDWLIPVKPSQLDLFSIAKMARLLEEVEEKLGRTPKTRIVISAAAASTTEAADARAMLTESVDIPVLDTTIVDRVAWRKAVRNGCGLVELTGKDASGPAVEELLSLYQEVFGETYRENT